MLVTTPLTVGAVAYFADGPVAGRWTAGAATELGLVGQVDPADLRAVLAGREPGGARLVAARPHRRAGFDLIFSAPKSVSLVAELGRAGAPVAAAALVESHCLAVGDAVGWLAEQAAPGAGVVAARFDHARSDRGDPHLHTHVVVANLACRDGRWGALTNGPFWPALRPTGGVYRSALVARARAAGLPLEWVVRPDGLVDLDGVPAGALAAASRRTMAVRATLAAFDEPSHAGRAARRSVRAAGRTAAPSPDAWRDGAATAGLDPERAASLLTVPTAAVAPVALEAAAAAAGAWLTARSSSFTRFDATMAVTTVAPGLTPAGIDAAASALVPGDGPQRATTLAACDTVERTVRVARTASGVTVARSIVTGTATELGAGVTLRAAVDELVGVPGVAVVLAGTPGVSALMAQAEVLAAARAVWAAAGWSVGLDAGPDAARRLGVLCGLDAVGRRPPDVLVVDRADRRPPPEIEAIVAAAADRGGRVVLVEGGTLPARHHPASAALGRLPTASFGPVPVVEVGERVQAGLVAVAASPGAAVAGLVADWATAPSERRPLLVGLGPAEVEALNVAARAARHSNGELAGPTVTSAGRSYQPGDVVVVLRGVRSGPAGWRATVTDVERDGVVLQGDGRALRLDRHDLRRVGHGYALSPARARHVDGPLLVLGDPSVVPALAARVVGAARSVRTGLRVVGDRLDRLADLLTTPAAAACDLASAPASALAARRRTLTALLHADLATTGDAGVAWAAAHAEALSERRQLSRAEAYRRDALATALEGQPSLHRCGPVPEPADDRRAWRARLAEVAAALDGPRITPGLGIGW